MQNRQAPQEGAKGATVANPDIIASLNIQAQQN